MKLYPIMLNITDKLVVIIGGGEVAYRKVKDLIDVEALIKIISPVINPQIYELFSNYKNKMQIIEREYEDGDLTGACLVYSATNNSEINKQIFLEAQEKNIFINAVDDPENCSFYVPSTLKRGDLIISVSTSGASPSMAAKIRQDIEKYIPDNIEEKLICLREVRSILKNDPDFYNLKVSNRGEIVKRITQDDVLLHEMLINFKNNSLKECIKKQILK